MSTQTLPTPAAEPAKPVGVVEYVRALSSDEKASALYELLRELIRVRGDSDVMPLRASDGQWLGYFVPPLVTTLPFPIKPPELTAEDVRQTDAALADPDNTFDMKDFMRRMDEEDRD